MNKDLCQNKACHNYGKYWRNCGHANGSLKGKEPIAKLSKKRMKIQQTEYGPKAKEFVKKHPVCQIKSPACTGRSEGVHHLAGRIGDKLTDQRYWKASCNTCNRFVEENDAYARANGFKLSKFSPELNKPNLNNK